MAHRLLRACVLLMRSHAQMPHGKDVPAQLGNDPQNRHVDTCQGLADDLFLPGVRHLIQQHARELEPRLEVPAAQGQRRHGAGRLGAVHHQEHRQVQEDGQFGRG